MRECKNISYHDSTILDIKKTGTDLILFLDDVQTDDYKSKVTISCSGVKKIVVENSENEMQLVYAPEGEVWDLELFGTYLNLIVDWHDFENHKCVIKSYYFEFENVKVQIA